MTDSLAPGEQKKIADVLSYLREKGLAIPPPTAQPQQGGTLLVAFRGRRPHRPEARLRDGPDGGADSRATAGGARRTRLFGPPRGRDLHVFRHRLRPPLVAVRPDEPGRLQHVGRPRDAEGDRLLRHGRRSLRGRPLRRDPAALGVAAVRLRTRSSTPTGISKGWAIVERTSTSGSFGAYGVINDNTTNDGSFVLPAGGSPSASTLTLPVLVETPAFRSELILANKGAAATAFALIYVESISPSSGAGGMDRRPGSGPPGADHPRRHRLSPKERRRHRGEGRGVVRGCAARLATPECRRQRLRRGPHRLAFACAGRGSVRALHPVRLPRARKPRPRPGSMACVRTPRTAPTWPS